MTGQPLREATNEPERSRNSLDHHQGLRESDIRRCLEAGGHARPIAGCDVAIRPAAGHGERTRAARPAREINAPEIGAMYVMAGMVLGYLVAVRPLS